MRIPCAMIRDLLPLYAEKMVAPETEALIVAHLDECAACRQKLSELEAGVEAPAVDASKPLKTLKREIQRRRRYAALITALCVFVAVYTWFYHASAWKMVPWEEGLIEVAGIEERPYADVYGQEADSDESGGATVEALILRVDSRINGTRESRFRDDDGTDTVLLQGWSTNNRDRSVGDYNEMAICPAPDRLIYEGSDRQQLLWGEPLDGGVEILPRLALGYYVLIAMAAAAVSGTAWFLLRKRDKSWMVRQIFFIPVAWLGAHLLIKGGRTVSDFMERDFLSILLIAAALYALLSLAWQVLLRRRKEA